MVPNFASLLVEADRALEREAIEARISALSDLRWELNSFIDDLIEQEEQTLNQQKSNDFQDL
jgi:hypothetical protein